MTTTHKAVRAALIAKLRPVIEALPGSPEFVVDDPRLIDVDEVDGIRLKVSFITGNRGKGYAPPGGGGQTIHECDHPFTLVVDAVGYDDDDRYDAVENVHAATQDALNQDVTLGGIADHARVVSANPETDKVEGQLPEMISAISIEVLYQSLRPTG